MAPIWNINIISFYIWYRQCHNEPQCPSCMFIIVFAIFSPSNEQWTRNYWLCSEYYWHIRDEFSCFIFTENSQWRINMDVLRAVNVFPITLLNYIAIMGSYRNKCNKCWSTFISPEMGFGLLAMLKIPYHQSAN